MRHTKRFGSLCLAAATAFVMTFSTAAFVYAEDTAEKAEEAIEEAEEEAEEAVEEIDAAAADDGEYVVNDEAPAESGTEAAPADPEEAIREYLGNFVKSVTTTLTEMDDEQIEQMKSSTDAFTAAAVSAWDANRSELGALKEEQPEDAVTVEIGDTTYTVTQKAAFEKADADFVYTIGASDGAPTDLAINVNLPMSVNLQRAGLNTLMGLLTVFCMLVFLSFIISLFKFIPSGEKKKAAAPAPAPVSRALAPEPEAEDETDDQELVAVIAAAIAAAEGTSPDGFVVRSIRRAPRSRR